MSGNGRGCLCENKEGFFGKACQQGVSKSSAKLSTSEATVRVREKIITIWRPLFLDDSMSIFSSHSEDITLKKPNTGNCRWCVINGVCEWQLRYQTRMQRKDFPLPTSNDS